MNHAVASLGSATHTRVDSAAKHIRQCRIHERLMTQLKNTPSDAMHRQKNKYATLKDDLVLNVNESLGVISSLTDAYPSVMSNFTDLEKPTQVIIKTWYAKKTPREFHTFMNRIKTKDSSLAVAPDPIPKQLSILPFFRIQGYALGRAEGCMRTGDTVFSVLIGGQMTVTNGDFAMRPGQMVQWYFDFESDGFSDDGRRSDKRTPHPISALGKRAHAEINAESTCRALPKPYVLGPDGTEHYGDKIRIFAKCICGGPAHQQVDIMLMTQSL